MNEPFSAEEIRRYSRHLILPEFGARGQKKLKASRVLVVGAGGLGSPAAMYLAAAGVGTLGLVDFDVVDLSNLQRQLLHGTADVGRSKLASATDTLNALNPHVQVQPHALRLSAENALALFAQYDLVLDGTDNFATRYLINDACVLTGKPNVSASVFRFEGQASVFCTPEGPCYRCLYPEPPPPGLSPSCGEGGVLGIVPGVIGTLQATEAIKVLSGVGQPLIGRLLTFDALEMSFRQFKVKKDASCPVCGPSPSITALIDYEQFCGTRAPPPGAVRDVTPQWLTEHRREVQLLDVREPGEREINVIEGSVCIPMAELAARFNELATTRDLVVYCKVGERSARAVEYLRTVGFERVFNLAGGIERWADEVDEHLPVY
ncbi:MAG: molybdopterin-synthase adenylyltransferase MoeB [Archangium sp.]|nr:molybdopterin-synthase adenylyltransferase MoeB [Archangium sp.]MDP3152149.1 molybdopterin-synthase adenylyltransferase MoeB [Archangium sp.]MDP3574969.1 molybdopterin-synthase adenylyltransferase MoeB [Archangium sp.]